MNISFNLRKLLLFLSLTFVITCASSQSKTGPRRYEIWDDQPAPNRGSDFSRIQAGGYPYDQDWEQQSYPIGNGYMGANIFGRTDKERIQITEKTLANEGLYGLGSLTNFAEIYLELNHPNPGNYKRTLNLNEAVLNVGYECDGVQYSREYFASYPDRVIAVKLSSDKKRNLSFTLSAEIPYLKSPAKPTGKTGKTFAGNNVITLSGNIPFFNVNYECQIKVMNDGGKLVAQNTNGKSEIQVVNANSAVIFIAAGTNYELSEKIFLEETNNKKLDGKVFPHDKISAIIKNASDKGYNEMKKSHIKDYQDLFSRVNLVLSPQVPRVITTALIEDYKKDASNCYLEELMFHFGRYLLISSSRKGTLPTGLQGIWSQYEVSPWTGGYWHNINVQMNYWGAFNTNLAETFIPYIEYFKAYYPKACLLATDYIQKNNPQEADLKTGNNGWTIGTGATAYRISAPGGHSGPGTGGFTSKLLWDYYDFTRDTTYLRQTGYPAILGMSRFLSKTLKPFENGLLLVEPSASPEQRNGKDYYVTKGTTFDQGFVWETYNDLLKAAQIIGVKDNFIDAVKEQKNHLDPILMGSSGQVKEYREENNYGEIGEKQHRHVSHLCPLYPGTLINSGTPEWIQGVITALDYRGNNTTGWAMAHRMNLRARTHEAEKAHEVYSKFLKERTLPNLWTFHPPFQIDGNFGTMAGVAEMLLQSHEGFIAPLPALPKAWSKGEFEGLIARGNFEISAKWENGIATSFTVKSKSGGPCLMKYKNIETAKITCDNGKIVSFKTKGKDMIEFSTQLMGVYSIKLQ